MSDIVAPKIEVHRVSCIKSLLDQLTYYKGFKQSTSGVVGLHVALGGDAKQPSAQAGVQKIELGSFDQAFTEIAVVGLQQVHHVRASAKL